ncbi:MAG TPA: ferrous iron transporter B, partial [Pyrodictium sp.]|nr:ferrous iron transporter B [Pyrodictium sp.]
MAGEKCRPLVALMGAPNSGKSTLFNRITGRSERVTNWPGTTVAVTVAETRLDSTRVCIADLPGTYSISGSGFEEKFARDFILQENPDLIIVLADLTTLPRSLYLPLEVLEIYPRVMIVLTKSDVLRGKNVRLDIEALERKIGIPIVAISALRGEGLDDLWKKIQRSLKTKISPRIKIEYGVLEPYIAQITELLEKH